MRLPALRTVQHKLLAVVLITTLVALVVALGASVTYNLQESHRNLVMDMATQSELLGHMTAPALTFDDPRLAVENLNLLRFRPQVRAAAIYTAGGKLFATYSAAGERPPFPLRPEADAARVEGQDLVVFKRIVTNGEITGTVYLRADSGFTDRMLAYLGIAVVVTLLAMLIAFLLSMRLQRLVTKPIQAISRIAREVVEQRDYSRRAEKISDDEVGVLVESFNNMLAEIERRTRDLESSNQEIAREFSQRSRAQQEVMRLNSELEARVNERTAQLQVSNEQLVTAKAAADKANLAKSEFLSSMSHELRTPLNAILGFAQLLASESLPLTPEKKKDFTGYILKAGQHLLVLINEVLDLAKVESGTLSLSMEPVNIAELMWECKELMEPLAAARHIGLFFPAVSDLQVVADRTRLKQVLINLLSNAIKYNRDGGSVNVDCTGEDGRVCVTIADTGKGLSEEQLQQLFQPFNRLGQEAGVEEGTGIGLVVTKRLIEMMGGRIAATSALEVGSTLRIELAAASPDAVAKDSKFHDRPDRIPSKGAEHGDAAVHTVLYVEDNPVNLKLVESVIGFRNDLKLLSAADGNLGVELARANQPDVILMDINLPGTNGNEALRILRRDSTTRHIPVIAITANAMPRDMERGITLGFFRYLTKPINIDELMHALDDALKVGVARRQDTDYQAPLQTRPAKETP